MSDFFKKVQSRNVTMKKKNQKISNKQINAMVSQMNCNCNCTFSLHIFIAHCTFSLQIVALKNEIGRNKCKILAQKKYKSTTATNPTELQASRKVAKPGEACQEALLKLCVKKIFIKLAQTWSPRIGGSNDTPFCLAQFFYGCENDLQS